MQPNKCFHCGRKYDEKDLCIAPLCPLDEFVLEGVISLERANDKRAAQQRNRAKRTINHKIRKP